MSNSYNIASSLLYGKNILHNTGINSYNLEARLLLSFVLKLPIEKIISSPSAPVKNEQFELYNQLLKRRTQNEPIAHLLGVKEFFSLEFIVTKDTLIPRPDSETLIETVLACFPDQAISVNILDLGVGTGCLLLTLLSLYKNAQGIGIDISARALEIAKINSEKLLVNQRVTLKQGDWCRNLDKATYDIIVSNPPYINHYDLINLDQEVKYEPHLALDGGLDGLECYRKIAPEISSLLNEKGKVFIEIGYDQELLVIDIFTKYNLIVIKKIKDLNDITRCLVFEKRILSL